MIFRKIVMVQQPMLRHQVACYRPTMLRGRVPQRPAINSASRLVRGRLVLAVLAVSCAATSQDAVLSDRVPRLALHYTNGDTLELEHQNAFSRVFDPSRPRVINDGTLTGRVCGGVAVQFDARWFAGTVTLSGWGEIPWQSFPHDGGPTHLTLGISELAPGHHKISGQFGGHIFSDKSSPIVDLDVSADHLQGRVDRQQFSLTAQGDYLAGRVQQHEGVPQPVDAPFAIYGRKVLSTIAPADEGLVLVAMLTCGGLVVEYDGNTVRGFALTTLERPKVPSIEEEVDEPEDGGVDGDDLGPERVDGNRTIEPATADATMKALREYKNESAIVYLPPNPTEEMSAIADSLVDIYKRAGLNVEQQTWKARSCQRRKYDLAVIGRQPATALETALALRLTISKLRVYVCQSAAADGDKLRVLVLPPHH